MHRLCIHQFAGRIHRPNKPMFLGRSLRLPMIATASLPAACLRWRIRRRAAEPAKAQTEFFENKIRPILSENCYKCHSVEKANPRAA